MSGQSILERMYAVIPGYKESKALDEYLAPYKRTSGVNITGRSDAAWDEVQHRIRAIIVAGEEVPEDVAEPILEARRLDELDTLRQRLLANLARKVSNESGTLVPQGHSAPVDFLRKELSELVAEVKKLAPQLKHVRSATEAIEAGDTAVAAWKRMAQLVGIYDEIRSAQKQVTCTRGSGVLHETLLNVGILGDALDLQEYWVSRRRVGASILPEMGGHASNDVYEYRRWLTELVDKPIDYTATWWDGDDKVQHLIRIACQATPWIPTVDELEDAARLAGTATGQVHEGNVKGQNAAAREYFQLTGAKPKAKLPEAPQVTRTGAFPTAAQQRAIDQKIRHAACWNP